MNTYLMQVKVQQPKVNGIPPTNPRDRITSFPYFFQGTGTNGVEWSQACQASRAQPSSQIDSPPEVQSIIHWQLSSVVIGFFLGFLLGTESLRQSSCLRLLAHKAKKPPKTRQANMTDRFSLPSSGGRQERVQVSQDFHQIQAIDSFLL